MKTPNFLPLIFKPGFGIFVVVFLVLDIRFMNVCQQSCLPNLQCCSLYHEFLLVQTKILGEFPTNMTGITSILGVAEA